MRTQNLSPSIRRLQRTLPVEFVLILLFLLSACSGVNARSVDGEPIRMSREAFAEHLEFTFRYHNRVVSELITIFSMSEEDIPFEPALIRAEEDMATRCQPLNTMVSAMIEGCEQSLWAKLQLLNHVPLCEAATRRVEQMLPTIR